MAGYRNRLIQIKFEELSEPDDVVWITIRNPKLVPDAELRVREVALDESGRPVVEGDAYEAMVEVFARLIVAWHVYDATVSVDEHGDLLDQPLLASPATPELVARLPREILKGIMEEVTRGADPR